jgi:phage tail sheath protein FI
VYVEETSFRPKTIEGVSTSTAGFVGPTRTGPTSGEPRLLTSFADFQRVYGGLEDLKFDGGTTKANYLAYAVRAFFEEGGQRCYVARTFRGNEKKAKADVEFGQNSDLSLTARFPGERGAVQAVFRLVPSGNLNAGGNLKNLSIGDTVFVQPASTNGGPVEKGFADYVYAEHDDSETAKSLVYNGGSPKVKASKVKDDANVHRVRVTVEVTYPSYQPGGGPVQYTGEPEGLGTFPPRPGSTESLADYFSADPATEQIRYETPFTLTPTSGNASDKTGAYYVQKIFGEPSFSEEDVNAITDLSSDARTVTTTLTGGSDGKVPDGKTYSGTDNQTNPGDDGHTGLGALQDLDDVSIVAAPGYSALSTTKAESVQNQLISHCERLQYRIAVLDTPKNASVNSVRKWRGRIDSTHAAMYYPWITIYDPQSRAEMDVPPSGHVAGIYARNDIENGVHKAPANEVVRSALGFEKRINKAQQDVLNPEGVNCFRFFEGRGNRLWGARMATSDSEYKYVNIRRYLAYLERSIDEGTQVFVFENNGTDLWRNVRRTIGSFLKNEWRSNRLMGTTPEEAYFVKCDRSTMTQNDIDNGRLICEIGVALFRPAEFVIFRIGQKLLSDTG